MGVVMVTGIDPKVDYVFKRLCGNEDHALLLVDLLNAVLGFPVGRAVTGVTLLNPFVPKDYAEGKVSVLDVRARDDPGRQFLLEMQRFVPPALAKRLLFYWAGGHADQLLKGERYELLQPTYTICLLNEPFLPGAAFHHAFGPYDAQNGVLLCKDFDIHVIELSKFDLPAEQVKTPLERWCYFFKHGAALEPGNLPAALDVPVIRQAVEVLVKISQSELERQHYLERQRAERDAANLAAEARVARQVGFEEGREKGFDEGRGKGFDEGRGKGFDEGRAKGYDEGVAKGYDEGVAKGEVIGRIRLLQRLLGQSETAAAELHQLSLPELEQREAALERQFRGPKPANGSPPANPA
jgi:predicted transposase/invertase (TIGR01784 family)